MLRAQQSAGEAAAELNVQRQSAAIGIVVVRRRDVALVVDLHVGDAGLERLVELRCERADRGDLQTDLRTRVDHPALVQVGRELEPAIRRPPQQRRERRDLLELLAERGQVGVAADTRALERLLGGPGGGVAVLHELDRIVEERVHVARDVLDRVRDVAQESRQVPERRRVTDPREAAEHLAVPQQPVLVLVLEHIEKLVKNRVSSRETRRQRSLHQQGRGAGPARLKILVGDHQQRLADEIESLEHVVRQRLRQTRDERADVFPIQRCRGSDNQRKGNDASFQRGAKPDVFLQAGAVDILSRRDRSQEACDVVDGRRSARLLLGIRCQR